eukprot:RCo034554
MGYWLSFIVALLATAVILLTALVGWSTQNPAGTVHPPLSRCGTGTCLNAVPSPTEPTLTGGVQTRAKPRVPKILGKPGSGTPWQLVLLPNTTRCMDGSAGGVYLRSGVASEGLPRKWILAFADGTGWCNHPTPCRARGFGA